jgi:hypothetical protein
MKKTVFWDVAPCSPVEAYQHFRVAYCWSSAEWWVNCMWVISLRFWTGWTRPVGNRMRIGLEQWSQYAMGQTTVWPEEGCKWQSSPSFIGFLALTWSSLSSQLIWHLDSALSDQLPYLKSIPHVQLTHCPYDGGSKHLRTFGKLTRLPCTSQKSVIFSNAEVQV